MLLAIEMERTDENGNTRIVVDVVPCDDRIILHGSRAFIVCMSSEDAHRFVFWRFCTKKFLRCFYSVKYYCSICYPVINNLMESQLKCMRKCSHSACLYSVGMEEIVVT